MNKPQAEQPYVIGLTGNIATGKSSVASMLAHLGAQLIDADQLAHQVMLPGTSVHQQVVERFGAEILDTDSQINRVRLGAIVFGDPQALRELEAIVHPAVLHETYQLLEQTQARVCVIEAIKLLETDLRRRCHAVWVVTCEPQLQADRLVKHRGLTQEQAWLRINAQGAQSAKVCQADVIIDNSGSLAHTYAQVLSAWKAIAQQRAGTETAGADTSTPSS